MPRELWIYMGGFTILQIVVWLVFLRVTLKSMKKKEEKDITRERETKLFKLYQEVESMMDSFEEYIDEVREDIEKERAGLIDMSRQAASLYVKAVERPQNTQSPQELPYVQDTTPNATYGQYPKIVRPVHELPEPEKPANPRLTPKDKESLRKFSTKAQKVRFLMSRGMSLEEVARELDIGKGEVKLIAELTK